MLKSTLSQVILRCRPVTLYRKAGYIRGFWPEPVTQTSLDEFFKDTNYFEEPKKFSNIGLPPKQESRAIKTKRRYIDSDTDQPASIDTLLNTLAVDKDPPPLSLDDAMIDSAMLTNLAINDGIYRDLFGSYSPCRDHVHFTQEQAQKMDRLVPHYWITDAPFSRVKRHQNTTPLPIFQSYVQVSANFIHADSSSAYPDETTFAHTSFYGNIIPACDTLLKPSITLNGSLLSGENFRLRSCNTNWDSGTVQLVNFDDKSDKLYSVMLLNLDYLHESAINIHWMLANISPQKENKRNFEEFLEYLPVHGIQGFGYSRYVFLVLQHDTSLKNEFSSPLDFSLESRKFDLNSFLKANRKANTVPIGLSWFQTSWDHSSNKIFHDYLKIKAPVYDFIQPKSERPKYDPYPGRIPFNIYLDHSRDKKDINKQVLLERLKSIDPTSSYNDQYVPPKVPQTIHQDELSQPHWMKNVLFKKINKIGYWRGLRPASALLPLNNNADLDYPIRPLAPASKVPQGEPNEYPHAIKYKPFKSLPHSKPVEEHDSVFIQETHEIHLDQAYRMMKEYKSKELKKDPKKSC